MPVAGITHEALVDLPASEADNFITDLGYFSIDKVGSWIGAKFNQR
jgi:hypothetical protein